MKNQTDSKLLLLTLSAVAALIFVAPGARAATTGPGTAAVKAANDSIRVALKKMVATKGTKEWPKARAQARQAVGQLLDFDALAKSTLGDHWKQITPAQQTRYVNAVRSAMEANYLTRMQGKVAVDDVKVDYLGEEPRGVGALVHTHFMYGTDGAKLDFVMQGAGKKEHAVDVITEDVSLAETYREQISTLWPKKGIDGVTAAFEKKATRLEADLEAAQAASAPAK